MLADPAAQLRDLAHRVARLSPSHRDPHVFHEDKSEIAESLRQLAAELRPVPAPALSPPARSADRRHPDSVRAAATHQRPAPAARRPVFGDDPGASSFLAWLLLVGAVEVSAAEARRATGLSKFAATCLLARFEDARILARAKLPARGGGRGSVGPSTARGWRLCSAVTARRRGDGRSPPNERTTRLLAKPWGRLNRAGRLPAIEKGRANANPT
jgi:hypothetical protein